MKPKSTFIPSIIFERWLDPYSIDDVKKLNVGIEDSEDKDEDMYLDDDVEFSRDGYIGNLEQDRTQQVYRIKPLDVIMTNIGPIPFYEHSTPSKVFNMYVGHTNFNITEKIADIIGKTPGIETLNIFTRYRFRVSIGKNFNPRQTLKLLEDSVLKYQKMVYNTKD